VLFYFLCFVLFLSFHLHSFFFSLAFFLKSSNGIYDVVDYALDLNSPHLNQWSQQYQHLIPYRPQRGLPKSLVSQSLLLAAAQSQAATGSNASASSLLAGVAGESMQEEDLPPRQWAVYSTHVPFAKAHPEIVRAQPFFYENVGEGPTLDHHHHALSHVTHNNSQQQQQQHAHLAANQG
jgi:hypothetical protein